MAMESIYNVPEFRYNHRVEQAAGQKRERREQEEEQKRKKKKGNAKAASLFESLADSIGQYSYDEPFQFNG
ncbi:MAG: hypothetical protein IGS03_08865 [Candidatus Sericytochromatia bacterium]|nr:hypothetical protein [Candidatus Sericytochromatia bacterium]